MIKDKFIYISYLGAPRANYVVSVMIIIKIHQKDGITIFKVTLISNYAVLEGIIEHNNSQF
jgi:hypothetical protein